MIAIGDQARPRVFVYCDDPSHGGRVAVAAFCPNRDRWDEWRARPARESGVTLVDGDRRRRPRYRLECGKCGGRSAAVLVEETLFAVAGRATHIARDEKVVAHLLPADALVVTADIEDVLLGTAVRAEAARFSGEIEKDGYHHAGNTIGQILSWLWESDGDPGDAAVRWVARYAAELTDALAAHRIARPPFDPFWKAVRIALTPTLPTARSATSRACRRSKARSAAACPSSPGFSPRRSSRAAAGTEIPTTRGPIPPPPVAVLRKNGGATSGWGISFRPTRTEPWQWGLPR